MTAKKARKKAKKHDDASVVNGEESPALPSADTTKKGIASANGEDQDNYESFVNNVNFGEDECAEFTSIEGASLAHSRERKKSLDVSRPGYMLNIAAHSGLSGGDGKGKGKKGAGGVALGSASYDGERIERLRKSIIKMKKIKDMRAESSAGDTKGKPVPVLSKSESNVERTKLPPIEKRNPFSEIWKNFFG